MRVPLSLVRDHPLYSPFNFMLLLLNHTAPPTPAPHASILSDLQKRLSLDLYSLKIMSNFDQGFFLFPTLPLWLLQEDLKKNA